jgi:ribosome-associated protein
MTTTHSTELTPEQVTHALEDMKALDITALYVNPLTSIADWMIICTGTSTRHVKAIADKLVETMKHQGHQPLGVEGQQEAEWVLVDLNTIIVHVMLAQTRDFYALEKLWQAPGEAA